jgi:hypothetical protein
MLTAATVLTSEIATLSLAQRFFTVPPTGNLQDAETFYMLTLAGGAVITFFLAYISVRKIKA